MSWRTRRMRPEEVQTAVRLHIALVARCGCGCGALDRSACRRELYETVARWWDSPPVVSDNGCDEFGECGPSCLCTEPGTRCDCACAEDGDYCLHGQPAIEGVSE